MEVSRVFRDGLQSFIIHVEILSVRRIAFIDQFNDSPFSKRHWHVAIQRHAFVKLIRKVRGCGKQQRLKIIDETVSQAKEITQGH